MLEVAEYVPQLLCSIMGGTAGVQVALHIELSGAVGTNGYTRPAAKNHSYARYRQLWEAEHLPTDGAACVSELDGQWSSAHQR